ncbi:unnamed protein product, partial [Choristocarpus tenellus]
IKFHETYYSANIMKLCVLGMEDLDTLEGWVREQFSSIRNRRTPSIPDYGDEVAFGPEQLGKLVTVVPKKETRSLSLSWPLPPRRLNMRSRPTSYISHLLGHEGGGGLYAQLHGRGWVSSVSAGSNVVVSDFMLFRLSLSLTKAGLEHMEEVVELCYKYIGMLRAEPPQKSVQDELTDMGKIRFQFQEKGDPSKAVRSVATTLADGGDPSEVLRGPYVIEEWDPEIISDHLERLTPENCQVKLVCKEAARIAEKEGADGGWISENWYGTMYKVEPLPMSLMHKLERPHFIDFSSGVEDINDSLINDSLFHLPGKNVFIPSDFALRCDMEVDGEGASDESIQEVDFHLPHSIPQVALDAVEPEDWPRLIPPTQLEDGGYGGDDTIKPVFVWHKMDRSYRTPRTVVVAKLWTPEPYGSPEGASNARLFTTLLREDLNLFTYDASLADLVYSVEMTTFGLQMSVAGFNSKVPVLMSKILGHINQLLEEYRALGAKVTTTAVGVSDYSDGSVEVEALSLRERVLLRRFETQRENLLRHYRNVDQQQPYQTATYYARQVLETDTWHISEYQRALEDPQLCSPLAMTQTMEASLSRLRADILTHGNIAKSEAIAVGQSVQDALRSPRGLRDDELPSRATVKLPQQGHVVVELEAATASEENSAVEVCFQVEAALLDLEAALAFINTVGQTSAFQTLRTEEQLGYIVETSLGRSPSSVPGQGPLGWSIVVQGPDRRPEELEERVEAWVARFRGELEVMSAKEFDATVAALLSAVLRRERNMGEEAQRMWGSIAGRTHDFFRRFRKADAYRRLTMDAVLAVFDKNFAHDAPQRRKLSVRVSSQRHCRGSQ